MLFALDAPLDRVGTLLARVPHLHVNTRHAQDFAYPDQENRAKRYRKSM